MKLRGEAHRDGKAAGRGDQNAVGDGQAEVFTGQNQHQHQGALYQLGQDPAGGIQDAPPVAPVHIEAEVGGDGGCGVVDVPHGPRKNGGQEGTQQQLHDQGVF